MVVAEILDGKLIRKVKAVTARARQAGPCCGVDEPKAGTGKLDCSGESMRQLLEGFQAKALPEMQQVIIRYAGEK